MKIVWLTRVQLAEGNEFSGHIRSRLEMCRHLAERGHKLHLLAHGKHHQYWTEESARPYKITALPVRSGKIGKILNALSLVKNAVALSKQCLPDFFIIEDHAIFPLLPLAIFSKLGLLSSRWVLDIRSFPTDTYQTHWCEVWQGKYRWKLNVAKKIFSGLTVITPFMRKLLSDQMGIPEKDIGIWSSGVDLMEFQPRNGKKMREAHGLENRFVVMYHGSLAWHRGLKETWEAVLSLIHTCPDMVYVVLGNDSNEEERAVALQLEKLSRESGAEKHFLFLRGVPYQMVAEYLAMADIGVSSYHHLICHRTASPLKVLEYLAMEKSVAVIDMESHRDLLGGAPFAFYAAAADAANIAVALKNAYYQRMALGQLGKGGRDLVKKSFAWKSQADRLESFLLRLSNKC